MSLTSGTRLGPYEITAQIGVGGMGEVYRATDTTLSRQVAIKVLPESLASDAERATGGCRSDAIVGEDGDRDVPLLEHFSTEKGA